MRASLRHRARNRRQRNGHAGAQECRNGQAEQASSALGAFCTTPRPTPSLALGITQIIAWGTTLYALGVLGKPIAADTGWSQTLVFGGLTDRPAGVGRGVDSGRPPDRSPRRPAGHGDRLDR